MIQPNKKNRINTTQFKAILSKNASEYDIQCTCIEWFDVVHKEYKNCLFAVPNGFQVGRNGVSNAISKKKMEKEGMRKGIADLILFFNGKVFPIEMKKEKGKLSSDQKQVHQDWSKLAKIETKVCYSVDEFIHYVSEIMDSK